MTETREDGAHRANISRKQPRPTWPKTNAHESSESVFSAVLERNIRNGLPVMAPRARKGKSARSAGRVQAPSPRAQC